MAASVVRDGRALSSAPTTEVPRDWPECTYDGCRGARSVAELCLRHAGEADARQVIGRTGDLDLRGVIVDQELLDRLLSYSNASAGDRRVFNHLRCEHAELRNIQFARLQLSALSLGAARFEGATAFRQVQCMRRAMLQRAVFDELSISGCRFDEGLIGGDCEFGDVVVSRSLLGHMTLFQFKAGTMSFADSQARLIEYTHATLETLGLQKLELDALELRAVQCGGGLIMTECSLKSALLRASAQGEAKIADCHFNGLADFDLVSRSEELGLWLSKNAFVDRPLVRVSSDGFVDMRGNRFYEGVDLLVEKGEVALDGTDFRRPAVLTTLAEGARPKLVSVRATNLVNLTVDDLDLSECRFAGAHNLDQLKFNGASLFGEAPRGLRLGRWPVRLAHRRVIAEEAAWRARCGKWWSSQWPTPQHRSWLGGLDDLTPPDIADIYRRLRKAREDQKDEPGAADFYYGEMEMRRHSEGTPRGEMMILGLYWALSGYGLRASRAFIALAALTLGLSFVMWRVGFAPIKDEVPSYWRSFTYSLGAAALHPPGRKLTTLGESLASGFRVIGPVLLGLILLSIRGRVRR